MPRGAPLALWVIAAAQGATLQPLPIVPRPALVQHLNGTFLVVSSAVIYADGDAQPIAQWFAEQLHSEFGIMAHVLTGAPRGRAFRFVIDQSLPVEGYRLRIDPSAVI